MLKTLSDFIFGANEDYYGSLADYRSSMSLQTTPAEDEWMLVDQNKEAEENNAGHPLENLLIEHPSMSVYCGGHRSSTDSLNSETQVATAAPTPAAKPCVSYRTEPYNLRKSTMQKAKLSKKQYTAKAYRRQNKVYNNTNRHVAHRPVVFQPRK